MPTVRSNNIEIAYEDYGNIGNPVLLLVMGLGLPSSAWPPEFIELFVADGFRVITFDNRDVGYSQSFDHAGSRSLFVESLRRIAGFSVRAPYQLTDMMHDIEGLIDALDIESAHVVGVSMGAMISQLMAIHAPQRVRSLTSIMSTTGNRSLPGATGKVARYIIRGPKDSTPAGRKAYHRQLWQLIGSPDYRPAKEDLEDRLERVFDRGMTRAGMARQAAAILAAESRVPQLKELKVPTIVIHGDADPLVPVECGYDTAAAIPGARITTISGMGHDLPRALWPRLTRMITEHARSADAQRDDHSPIGELH